MTEHNRLVENIQTKMAFYISNLRISNDRDYFDENKEAEFFFRKPLSLLFDANVTNANSEQRNFPGIDLADKKEGICFQITSTNTKKKVQHTLDEFLEHKLDDDFDRLIVLIVTLDTPPKCSGLKFKRPCDFNVKRDVWNISRLVQEFENLPADKRHLLQAFSDYLDQELLSIEAPKPRLELPLYSALQASGFVGRQLELEKIRRRFTQADKLVVLTGLGGMGKTELAVQYGREHTGKVYFTRFDSSFTRTLANMAQGIRPALSDEQLRHDEEILSGIVLKLLEESDKNDLLIIDNVDSDTGTLAALQRDKRYQALRKCPLQLLMTTRSDAPRAIRVGAMPSAPLFEIFDKHGTILETREMEDLIKAVKGHTLTVDLIARTLSGGGLRNVTAESMLKALRENTLPSEKYRKIVMDYNQSAEQAQIYQHLSTVFDLSDMLDEEKAMLGIATLFPENGIDGDLVADIVSDDQAERYENLIARGWLEKKSALLTIHPIIRLVCRTEIPPTNEGCGAFLTRLWERHERNEYHAAHYSQIAELLTNAYTILADIPAQWALRAGILWNVVGSFPQALKCAQCAVAKMEQCLPSDAQDLALAYYYVGNIYGNQGNHQKALEYKLKAIEIREKVLPPDHPDLAQSYNNVGSTYSDLSKNNQALEYRQKALEYRQKALTIRKKVLPPKHSDLALSYNNVGRSYSNLNDHTQALEYHQKALEIWKNTLPPEHPLLAHCYSDFAWAYHGLGNIPVAAQYMRQAAEIVSQSSLPENHPKRIYYPKQAAEFEHEAKMQQDNLMKIP